MNFARAKLDATPLQVLAALRHAGGVMLGVRSGPALLERMGLIERVEEHAPGFVRVVGASHQLALLTAAVTAIVVDRTMKMRDRVLPRVHFLGAVARPLVSATALDDADAFEAALAPFGQGEAPPEDAAAPREPATAEPDDPGAVPLRRAAGRTVTLTIARYGVVQRYTGALPEPQIAMGFVNIILPDCHLHLRGGAISGWKRHEHPGEADAMLEAMDAAGVPIGLMLAG